MADNSLGSTSLKLTTDAKEMELGLSQAQSKIAAWTGKVNAAQPSGGSGGLLGSLGLAAIAGPVGIAFGAVVAGAGLAHGAIMSLQGGMKDIVEENKLAERLNVPWQNFQRMMSSVKATAAELGQTLQTMGSALTLASSGSSRAMRPFRGLGIGQEEVQSLAGGGADNAFNVLAEKLKAIGPGLQQTHIASQLGFTLEMLGRVNGDMSANILMAEKYGLIIGDSQMEAAKKADNASKETGLILTGLWRQASIAAAPYIQLVNDGIVGFWRMAQPLIQNAINTFSGFAEVIGAVGHEFMALFDSAGITEWIKSLNITTGEAKNIILDSFAWIGKWIGKLTDLFIGFAADYGDYVMIPMIQGFASITRTMAEFLGNVSDNFVTPFIAQMSRLLEAMRGIASLDPTGTLTERLNVAQQNLNAIPDQIDGFVETMLDAADSADDVADGLIPANAILRNLAGTEAAIGGFFDRARERMNQPAVNRDVLNNGFNPQMFAKGLELMNKFESPLDKMKVSMSEINRMIEAQNQLWEDGADEWAVYIDEATAGRALQDALTQAESALKIGPAKFAGFMQQGSQAAANLLYHRDSDNTANDPAERLRIIAERSLAQQAIQTQQGAAMIELLRDRPELLSI